MKHITLGANGLDVGRVGLGCMGMSAFYSGAGQDDAASIATIHRAIELGVTLFDTAEMYGPYINEELLATALAGRRDEVVIATKFGTLLHRGDGTPGLDGSPENMRLSVEGSLRRLNIDHIDLQKTPRRRHPPQDVARELGISVPTLYRWIPAGTVQRTIFSVF